MTKLEVSKTLKEIAVKDTNLVNNSSFFIEFKRKINNKEVTFNELTQLIKKEPTLSAFVLKVANSGIYPNKKQIGSVKKAITTIGLKELENVIVSNFMNESFKLEQNHELDNLWKHSLGVAIASKIIAHEVDPEIEDQVFSIGLLHDIGIFIIERYFTEEFKKISEEIKRDPLRRRLLAEKKYLGITHQVIGAFFVSSWNLPDFFVETIKKHHYFDQKLKSVRYASIIFVADNIIKGMEIGKLNNCYVNPIPKWIWRKLKIQKKDFKKIIPKIQLQYNMMYSAIKQ